MAHCIRQKELVDAKWFTKDQVRKALRQDPDAGFQVPPKTAIAHTLLKDVSTSTLAIAFLNKITNAFSI